MAVLAAGVQQWRVRVQDLRATLDRMTRVRRRRLMYEILSDVEGGAQALSELDFTRQVIRRFRLPEPSRQVGRRDSRGRQRWIDVLFDEWKVAVEIDGAQHITPLEQWDDMERDNDLSGDGYQVLRFPAWLVRRNPEIVAGRIHKALRANGHMG
jgi:very-short-patch-repair endonuclease